ncbi:ABC transporter permease [Dactylosporangium sp. NPDC051485]|uniref:ABC transporter permease n=1 Tax=Dactylosporangium sp. NPDC051485 TaxID=3154846 RepID=UPI003440E3D4
MNYVGTWPLVRLALRRDRISLPLWVLILGGIPSALAGSLTKLYPTVQSRIDYASGLESNPATAALYGHAFSPDTIGGLTAMRIGAIGATLTGLMNILLIIRHTRAEEQAGRRELLGAGAVGRQAPLAAAFVIAVIADLLIALVCTLGLKARDQDPTGALALGLGLALCGLVFAAIAAVVAQLTTSSRSANGISIALLGGFFILRGLGDASGDGGAHWLSWISPIGWGQQLRPFATERWWVLLVMLAAAVVLALVAWTLSARRDMGAGLLADRPGSATGERMGTFALAWRLQRGSLLGWTFGFAVVGVVIGSAAKDVGKVVNGSAKVQEALEKMGGRTALVDAFLAAMIALLGLAAAAYAVSSALRLRAEENDHRIEPLLAGSVTRGGWMAGHLAFAFIGAAVPLAAAGLTMGLVHGARVGDVGGQAGRILGAALVQLPAVWVLAGIAVALFGLAPRLVAVSWAGVGLALLFGQFGSALDLSQGVRDISPFTHLPRLPGGEFQALPVTVLVVIAIVLAAAGLVGFRRRDVS